MRCALPPPRRYGASPAGASPGPGAPPRSEAAAAARGGGGGRGSPPGWARGCCQDGRMDGWMDGRTPPGRVAKPSSSGKRQGRCEPPPGTPKIAAPRPVSAFWTIGTFPPRCPVLDGLLLSPRPPSQTAHDRGNSNRAQKLPCVIPERKIPHQGPGLNEEQPLRMVQRKP